MTMMLLVFRLRSGPFEGPAIVKPPALPEDIYFDFFDIVYSRNSLDHCHDPIKGLDQMISVTKPGGYVVIEGIRNEAIHENWIGMHNFNFDTDDTGDFIISNKIKKYSVKTQFKKKVSLKTKINKSWLVVIIRKLED
ncbi:MAG: class I SAM-dependent methyltransferase [Proteobacteria bacterium]|nr:class I SAM-dependent methyltransferase [Pseudomonadota bacterium]